MRLAGYRVLVSDLHSNSVAPVLDDLHDLRHILLAGVVVRGFHHYAHQRLRTGLTDKDTTGIAQCFCHRPDCCPNGFIVLCSLLVGHTDILQHLRIAYLSSTAMWLNTWLR